MTHVEQSDATYLPRMRVVQRWRRIVNVLCLFVVLYVALLMALDRPATENTTWLMVQSLAAFAVAAVLGVSVLTFLLRKPPAR